MAVLEVAPRRGSLTMEVNFGKYRLLHKLGEGGAANVYLALLRGPAGFRKLCVVKCLKRALARDKVAIASFLAEAQLSARLLHPNIVQANEVTEIEGIPALVLEYLDGRSLAVLRKELTPPLPLPLHVYALSEALRGLHYFHRLEDESGVPLHAVHRDVSPQNVVMTFEGEVKLVDFGIAKQIESQVTAAGLVKGKLHYLAPEQLRLREEDQVDARTDVFALGIMLWEAVAGRSLYYGLRESEVLRRCFEGRYPSLREAAPEAPPLLLEVVEGALQARQADRFESAEAMRAALEPYLEVALELPGREAICTFLADKLTEERSSLRRLIADRIAHADPGSGEAEWVVDPVGLLSIPPAAHVSRESESPPTRHVAQQGATAAPATSATPVTALSRPWPPLSSTSLASWLGGVPGLMGLVLLTAALGISAYAMLSGTPQPPGSASGSTPPIVSGAELAKPTRELQRPRRAQRPCARPTLLFDFEEGQADACIGPDRAGGPAVVYFDGTGTVAPDVGEIAQSFLLPEPRGNSRYALRLVANGLTDWGCGIVVLLNDRNRLDLSRYEGLRIWLLATPATGIRVGLGTSATLDKSYHGECEAEPKAACGDHFSVRRVVAPIWSELRIKFADLKQEGWGKPATWDPREVKEIHISAYRRDPPEGKAPPLSTELWVDDAELY